jgi:hypothetical protein
MLSRRKIHACTLHLRTQQQRPLMADCHSQSDWKGRGLFPEKKAMGRAVKDKVVFGSIVASGMHTSKDYSASLPQCRLLHPSLSPVLSPHFLSICTSLPGRSMPPDVVINMLSSADKSRLYSASKTQQQRPSMAGLSQTRSGKGLDVLHEKEGSSQNGGSCGHSQVF